MFTKKEIIEIVDMYDKDEKSTYVIAQKYNTYPNKIRNTLIKNGIKLRDKSAAQKKALETGRSLHPTEGKERPNSVKEKISDGIFDFWKKMSDEDYQKIVDNRRERWYNMSASEREEMHTAAIAAVREASKSGSKVEHFLRDELEKLGYVVIFHKKGLLANQELEIDLFLPGLKTAIEIDGPSHFLPIWGEDKLKRHISADADKAGLLLSSGLAIIRIKYLVSNFSEKYKRELLKMVLSHLKEIEKKFPSKGKRYMELEVQI